MSTEKKYSVVTRESEMGFVRGMRPSFFIVAVILALVVPLAPTLHVAITFGCLSLGALAGSVWMHIELRKLERGGKR